MARLKSNKALGCGCLSVVMGLIVIVVILGSAYLLNFALKPSHNKGRDYPKQYAVMLRRYPWIKPWADSLYKVKALRDTYITVRGGDTRFLPKTPHVSMPCSSLLHSIRHARQCSYLDIQTVLSICSTLLIYTITSWV